MIPTALLIASLACPPLAACPLLDTPAKLALDTVTFASATTVRADTVHRRVKPTEVSDAYAFRLRVHHYASYATIPLFVAQSVAGNQLYQADKSGAAKPAWASGAHRVGATGLAVLFTVNTVTGVWNLWDSRHSDVGRTKRLIHSALLLASDGGFALAGATGSEGTESSQAQRANHKNISYVSMGAALVGYGIMLVGNH